MLKNKRFWDFVGAILGIIIIVVGIVFMASPPRAFETESTEYASFGADFYTYQYDATRAAATNSAVTANNLREIGSAQAKYFGFLFIVIGALTTLNYGKKYFTENIVEKEEPKEEDPAVIIEEIPQE